VAAEWCSGIGIFQIQAEIRYRSDVGITDAAAA
jgi:hypothetical protein